MIELQEELLTALNAIGLNGPMAQMLLQGNIKQARTYLGKLRNIFAAVFHPDVTGKDDQEVKRINGAFSLIERLNDSDLRKLLKEFATDRTENLLKNLELRASRQEIEGLKGVISNLRHQLDSQQTKLDEVAKNLINARVDEDWKFRLDHQRTITKQLALASKFLLQRVLNSVEPENGIAVISLLDKWIVGKDCPFPGPYDGKTKFFRFSQSISRITSEGRVYSKIVHLPFNPAIGYDEARERFEEKIISLQNTPDELLPKELPYRGILLAAIRTSDSMGQLIDIDKELQQSGHKPVSEYALLRYMGQNTTSHVEPPKQWTREEMAERTRTTQKPYDVREFIRERKLLAVKPVMVDGKIMYLLDTTNIAFAKIIPPP